MARKAIAGVFLGVVMTLSLAGVAAAQSSNSNSNSNSNTNSSTSSSSAVGGTTRSSTVAGRTTARTGMDMLLPLLVGGLVITVAIGTRVGLSRAAART
jgi:hypothetical protein